MPTPANGIDFNSVVFFGDSLTDPGNLAQFGAAPPPPYFNGRFSNGPTYAELLPGLISVAGQANLAFGGARALDSQPAPIDLPEQVGYYLGALGGQPPPPGTAAALYIGNNDFLGTVFAGQAPPSPVDVVNGIIAAATTLTNAGISKIILFTLPNVTFTPLAANPLAAPAVPIANALVDQTNALIRAYAATTGAEVVDTNKFTNEIGADPSTFGFLAPLSARLIDAVVGVPGAPATGFAPDEVAFWDDVHPTAAAHEVTAAFVAASLAADTIVFAGSGNDVRVSGATADLVFAGAGQDVVSTGGGDDIAFGGTGDDVIHAGAGNDIVSGGSGNDVLNGGNGVDVLAGNDGNDVLDGGNGDDVLILGRGSDRAVGGRGDDLFIILDEPGVGEVDRIDGGRGHDTLVIEVGASAAAALQADLLRVGDRDDGYLASIGLRFTDIEQIEVVIVGEDLAAAAAVSAGADQAYAIQLADLWGFI